LGTASNETSPSLSLIAIVFNTVVNGLLDFARRPKWSSI